MRKSNQQSIGTVIKKLLKNQQLDGRLQELDLLDKCKEILGENLMKFVNELSIKNGKLTIKVNSAVVRSELSYQKSKIIKKMNDVAGSKIIKEITLK
ncbi:MAG: DUF721 domain-containing protein [Bacteroidota bacterium]|nr:DUF721 domain-containing protein [Bacteroidota bacterium]